MHPASGSTTLRGALRPPSGHLSGPTGVIGRDRCPQRAPAGPVAAGHGARPAVLPRKKVSGRQENKGPELSPVHNATQKLCVTAGCTLRNQPVVLQRFSRRALRHIETYRTPTLLRFGSRTPLRSACATAAASLATVSTWPCPGPVAVPGGSGATWRPRAAAGAASPEGRSDCRVAGVYTADGIALVTEWLRTQAVCEPGGGESVVTTRPSAVG